MRRAVKVWRERTHDVRVAYPNRGGIQLREPSDRHPEQRFVRLPLRVDDRRDVQGLRVEIARLGSEVCREDLVNVAVGE